MNGNGDGKATGKPCAGCKGKADNKNPKGQRPDASDRNNGYECDGNQGIAKGNPAHTACVPTQPPPPPPPPCVPTPDVPCEETPPPPVCVPTPEEPCAPTDRPRPPVVIPPEVLGVESTTPVGFVEQFAGPPASPVVAGAADVAGAPAPQALPQTGMDRELAVVGVAAVLALLAGMWLVTRRRLEDET